MFPPSSFKAGFLIHLGFRQTTKSTTLGQASEQPQSYPSFHAWWLVPTGSPMSSCSLVFMEKDSYAERAPAVDSPAPGESPAREIS